MHPDRSREEAQKEDWRLPVVMGGYFSTRKDILVVTRNTVI